MKRLIIMGMLSLGVVSCGDIGFGQGNSESTGRAIVSTVSLGGSLARFTIVGNYLYSVDNENLVAYSLLNNGIPELVSTVHVGFEIETIYPFKDKLFIGSTSSVHIFSISDPAKPESLSKAISPQILTRCDPVVAKDDVAYATLRVSGPCGWAQSVLAVYDIRDIYQPIEQTTVPVTDPNGLGYYKEVLYVGSDYGLVLFDISSQFEPKHITNLDTSEIYYDVIAADDLLICWVAGGMVIYDIADPADPKHIINFT